MAVPAGDEEGRAGGGFQTTVLAQDEVRVGGLHQRGGGEESEGGSRSPRKKATGCSEVGMAAVFSLEQFRALATRRPLTCSAVAAQLARLQSVQPWQPVVSLAF